MSDDYEPLTDDELRAGDGYEPAVTDVDMTPRPRFGETWKKFAKRMRTQVVDGIESARPDAAEEDRFNRYLAKKCRDSSAASTDDDPIVQIICGTVYVCMSDGKMFPIERPRWLFQLSAGIHLAQQELERRSFR